MRFENQGLKLTWYEMTHSNAILKIGKFLSIYLSMKMQPNELLLLFLGHLKSYSAEIVRVNSPLDIFKGAIKNLNSLGDNDSTKTSSKAWLGWDWEIMETFKGLHFKNFLMRIFHCQSYLNFQPWLSLSYLLIKHVKHVKQ